MGCAGVMVPFFSPNSEDLAEANAMPGIVMSHRKTEAPTSGLGGFLDSSWADIWEAQPPFPHVFPSFRKEGLNSRP